MKMKNILVISLLMAICNLQSIGAQESEQNSPVRLTVGNFEYVKKQTTVQSVLSTAASALVTSTVYLQDESYVPHVRETFQDAVSSLGRIRLYDGEEELEADVPCIKVDGKISSIGYSTDLPSKYASGTIEGYVECTLQIRDGRTNELLDSKMFKKSGYEFSVEGAIGDACRSIRKEFRRYLNSRYPLHGSVLEKGLLKKGKIKDLYIDLGSELNMQKDMVFNVFEVNEVAGRMTRKGLGKLKVTEVAGDDISLCKVVKGEDKIRASLDAGKRVIVISE